MENIYNPLKLSEYRPLFHSKRVLIIGSGAVGTYLTEYSAKAGVSVDTLDFDYFTIENAAKHSCLIRTPEDANKNKAQCSSERVQPFLDTDCSSNGIDGDVCRLGPEAFSDYDVVFAAVDNYDAKVLLNELIRQLPDDRRPVVIMDGTYNESAQSVMLDNSDFCIRCLIDESWMKHSSVRNSCSGPQIREIDGVPEIVRTSNLASSLAAHLSCEQFRAYVLGDKSAMNHRLIYTAYPNLSLDSVSPMKKHNCPGCAIHPPQEIRWLNGTVLDVKLRDALKMISENLGTDIFELSVHKLNIKNSIFDEFVVDDVCHCCGQPIPVMRHSGRLFLSNLRCEKCKNKDKTAYNSPTFSSGTVLYAFTANDCDEIQNKTLYDLGYPLGAHINAVIRRGDIFDDNYETHCFAFNEDHEQMHKIKNLL